MASRMPEKRQAHTRVGTRFVGLQDEPLSLDEWAELYENFDRRIVMRYVQHDGTQLVLMWCGEILPEAGMLPWAILLYTAEGTFIKEVEQYPSRKVAEWWFRKALPADAVILEGRP